MKQIGRFGLWVPEDTDAPDGPSDLTKLAESITSGLDKSGGQSAMSVISGAQSRENAAYGVLGTADQVNVTLDKASFVDILFYGEVKQSVSEAGRAALFIDSTQAQAINTANGAFTTGPAQTPKWASTAGFMAIFTDGPGIDVVGAVGAEGLQNGCIIGAAANDPTVAEFSSVRKGATAVRMWVTAGEHTISVRYKASSGKIEARNRVLAATAYNGLY